MNVWLIMRLPLYDGATSDVVGIFADEGSALLGVKRWIDEHGYRAHNGVISSTQPTMAMAHYYNGRQQQIQDGGEWLGVELLIVASHKVGEFIPESESL